MGCPIDFRESGGFGYQLTEHWDIIASVEHIAMRRFAPTSTPASPMSAPGSGISSELIALQAFQSIWREPWRMRSITTVWSSAA